MRFFHPSFLMILTHLDLLLYVYPKAFVMWFLFLRRYSHVQNLRSNGHGRVSYQRFSLQLKKQSQNIFDTIFS